MDYLYLSLTNAASSRAGGGVEVAGGFFGQQIAGSLINARAHETGISRGLRRTTWKAAPGLPSPELHAVAG